MRNVTNDPHKVRMELTPGTLLKNRYRIESLLGQGGMGAVYLAVDTSLDNRVAVKTNRSPAADSAEQFLREARLLASLRHPNLPRVTDYFILEELQFLVMDYIAGQDLETLIKSAGRQPVERVSAWARQLGSALSYLHHQNPPVIHRDVKPANVRLTHDGSVILVDFGIAKAVDSSQATTAGASHYTPGYAPPEQYGGMIRTGAYTDQYSLAALIYHLITGIKPADAIQRALSDTLLAPMSQFIPGIPPNLQSAVDRALSLRPADRFADIDEFLHAMDLPPGEKTLPGAATIPHRANLAPTTASTQETIQRRSAALPGRKNCLLLAAAFLGIAASIGLALIFLPRLVNPARGSSIAIQVSQTPQPTTQAPTSSASPRPSQTPVPTTPAPSATVPLSPTPAPSETLTRTPTPLSIGGGGVIVFSSSRGDGTTFQLWAMRVWFNDQGQVISGDLKQLTHSEGDKRQPAWSPDGKKIVYVAPGTQGNDIWMMNADGSGAPAAITSLRGDESEPAWSPDGSWIAFTSDGRGDKVLMLYLVRPDGSELVKLSSFQHESGPTWSPKMQLGFVMNIAGSQVLYIRGQNDPNTGATPTQPYYVTPGYYDQHALHGNLGQVAEPAWSPDGQWVAYTRQRSSGSQIYLAHYPVRAPVEKDILRLTGSNSDSNPAWSPDGQWIVFTSKRDGNAEIYIIRSTGKSQHNLTLNPAEDMDPAWQGFFQP